MSKNVAVVIEELIAPKIAENNMELVDVDYVKEGGHWVLKVFIDKPGGIDLDDCQLVSKIIGPVLDEYDPVPNSYTLEVSSPGINRPLKKLSDFKRFQGGRVSLNTFGPVDGQRRFNGILKGVEGDQVRLDIGGRDVLLPFKQVAKANLAPEFDNSGG